MMCQVDADELAALLAERKYLSARVDELLDDMYWIDRNRMVREFFTVMEQPIGVRPHVPEEASVRLGLRLIAEEFFELMRATLRNSSTELIDHAEQGIQLAIRQVPLAVNLPELVDATVDLDYVIEGLRIRLGVDSTPVWQIVQEANLAKLGGPKDEQGKRLKPDGWKAPDIDGELRKQGWLEVDQL